MRSPNDVAACPRKPVTDFAQTQTHMQHYRTALRVRMYGQGAQTAANNRRRRHAGSGALARQQTALAKKRRYVRPATVGSRQGRRPAGLEHPARQQAPTAAARRALRHTAPRRLSSSPFLFFCSRRQNPMRGRSCVFFYSRRRAVILHRRLRLSVKLPGGGRCSALQAIDRHCGGIRCRYSSCRAPQYPRAQTRNINITIAISCLSLLYCRRLTMSYALHFILRFQCLITCKPQTVIQLITQTRRLSALFAIALIGIIAAPLRSDVMALPCFTPYRIPLRSQVS